MIIQEHARFLLLELLCTLTFIVEQFTPEARKPKTWDFRKVTP
jgi:hypothetical protein